MTLRTQSKAADRSVRWALQRAGMMCILTLPVVGCHSGNKPKAGPERHFVRGQVLSVDPGLKTVLLAHEAIPGFMPAMTMEYKVADPAVLEEVHPGDRIAADVLNDRDAAGPRNLRLASVDVLAEARPDHLPRRQYHVPARGDAVPDFALLNQSGRSIRLGDFKGRVLLLTFVYTRCPLADFCPRMSRNFAEINKRLAEDPVAYRRTHLLTVSFDPEYDTPRVLRSYGSAYTGRYSRETFEHWDFAAPSKAELGKMEEWFDVGVTPAGNALQHSLATAVIGTDGKVVAFYPTNDWKVEDVLGTVKRAALEQGKD